jgi:MarR family transcriptional regulator, organic hydroperoxide resistance regulator
MPSLQDEIKQTKPFKSRRVEAFLNLIRTADLFQRAEAEFLKPYNLTAAQYNVLRILRGAGPEGLPCSEISDRMIARDPDVTRLLDRMEAKDLVQRCREQKDRRVVTARISETGLSLVNEISEINLVEDRLFRDFSDEDLDRLNDLLEKARERAE